MDFNGLGFTFHESAFVYSAKWHEKFITQSERTQYAPNFCDFCGIWRLRLFYSNAILFSLKWFVVPITFHIVSCDKSVCIERFVFMYKYCTKDFTKHCEACTLVWRDEISLEVKSMRILFIWKWFIALFQLQKINLPSGL